MTDISARPEDLSPAEVERRLTSLREEHRDLDAAVEAMAAMGTTDLIGVARLKKRKLALKDQIQFYEDMLNPDIIA